MGAERARCVVLDDYQGVATAFADWSTVDVEVVSLRDHVDGGALVEALREATIVVAMRERTAISSTLLARLPRLRLLVTTGMSNAVIDLAAAAAAGVTVCGTLGTIGPTVEHTWGLIHALARNIPADDRAMRTGGWQTAVGRGLSGKRLGVLGLGRIGSKVAAVGQAFGMEVVAWSENLTAARAEQCGATLVPKEELLRTSDVVTIHLVLSARTRGLLGRAELAMMKRDALLVNTSRGPIVDHGALVDALRSSTIGGAGLDVFDVEPLPADDPLRSLPNTVLTPHTGYVTDDCYRIFFEHIVEDIGAWLAGSPVRVLAAP